MKRKPTADKIVSSPPLSVFKKVKGARACNLCGEDAAVGQMRLYRECTAFDRPIDGDRALLFVAGDHKACMDRVDKHPRLYVEDRGAPGTFPRLCGGCIHRQGFVCTHQNLKANGGAGLTIGLDPIAGMVVCVRGAGKPLAHALTCEGQELPGERAAAPAEEAS